MESAHDDDDDASARFGPPPLDRQAALVNNAGIPYTIPVELLPLEELRKVFDVNCVGLVGVTQVNECRFGRNAMLRARAPTDWGLPERTDGCGWEIGDHPVDLNWVLVPLTRCTNNPSGLPPLAPAGLGQDHQYRERRGLHHAAPLRESGRASRAKRLMYFPLSD